MSAERLTFGFNSLIPETYKSKAEAFARCLHHKLLSLGRIDPPAENFNGETRKRLNSENTPDGESGGGIASPRNAKQCSEIRMGCGSAYRKTDDSEEELCSHSESENGNSESGWREAGQTMQKLTTMSSEDSTLDSWGSCQENLDLEKLDSETEEVSALAAQIKGSPKLRSFNIRAKRKKLREKTWKKNPKKNHSSSTENVDSEGVRQGHGRQTDDFDREFSSQYILLDGLEPDDDDVPLRILRSSCSTSNLERHFSCREDSTGSDGNAFKLEKRASEERVPGMETELLTPPPSPDLNEKPREMVGARKSYDLSSRLCFAEIETDFGEIDLVEVEFLKEHGISELCGSVRKVGGVIIECAGDNPKDDIAADSCESIVITSVEVLEDTSNTEPGHTPDSESSPRIATDVDSQEPRDIATAEDDDILNSRSNMRRCSSLKTWKTPPGTPGAKKIVRFADALGLDLADVRTFLDEIPKIPSSAYQDLHFDSLKPEQFPPPPPLPPPSTLFPLFQQPGTRMDFLERVQNQKISLESTIVTLEGVATVTGFVRVQNVAFHKSVHVRYTLNNWETFSDLQATYVPNSCDGFSDRFSFALYGHTLKIGQKLEFALRLECCGLQYWDNNGGANYVFHCLPQISGSSFFSTSCSSQVDPWFDFY